LGEELKIIFEFVFSIGTEYFFVFAFPKNKKTKQTIIFDFFQQIMNSCEFEEIIVSETFEFDNGVLKLERDVYLSIVKFLDSSTLRKVRVNFFFF
jgi:hypothetical protein